MKGSLQVHKATVYSLLLIWGLLVLKPIIYFITVGGRGFEGERDDWRKVQAGEMEERCWEQDAGRRTADALREGFCSAEEPFPFSTVNNSPCLSWTAFTAAFVRSDILGSLKSGEGSASRVFTGMGKAEH